MRVALRYGREGLDVHLPDANLAAVLRLRPVSTIADLDAALAGALARPYGSPALSELARGKRSAVVAVCDATRPVPNALILPPILRTLEAAGVPRSHTRIIVATGMHHPTDAHHLWQLVGEEAASWCEVVSHDGRDEATHAYLGATRRGTPAYVDARYCQADLKVLVGLVEPHFMAGFSGGRKLVAPGLSSWRTVRALHAPSLLDHPLATSGVIDRNPVHDEMLSIARMAGRAFCISVTLNEERRVTGVWAGDMERSHLLAAQAAAAAATVRLSRPAGIVVTTGAGHPLDATFYQCVKGYVGALPAVKQGGTIILAASMNDGVGSAEFREGLKAVNDPATYVERLKGRGCSAIDRWQIQELCVALRKARLVCVSGAIDADTLRTCHVEPASSVEEAVGDALARHGPNASVIAIPDGPYVIPCVPTVRKTAGPEEY